MDSEQILLCEFKKQCLSSHLGDLERFMAHWQENPKDMCHFVGRAVARVAHRNFSDLFFAISTAYFAFQEVCERIDFIYDNHKEQIKGERGQLLTELVEVEEQMGVVCLKDVGGNHDGIRVMLVRDTVDGYLTYSLRYFVKSTERLTRYLSEYWKGNTGKPTFKKVLHPLPPDSPQLYEDDFDFWNFRSPVEIIEGVIMYPEARGFYDLHESKSIADFIVLTSNLLGFGKCIRQPTLCPA